MYYKEVLVTPHFKFAEFGCKDGTAVPTHLWYNMRMMAGNLEALRGSFQSPIIINSAFRTSAYNKKVGGAAASQHLSCNAVDINVKGQLPSSVFHRIIWLMTMGVMEKGAVILYDGFVHYDRRGHIIKIDNRQCKNCGQ